MHVILYLQYKIIITSNYRFHEQTSISQPQEHSDRSPDSPHEVKSHYTQSQTKQFGGR